MKTYDEGAGTHGKEPWSRSLKRWWQRAFNRERELISLRNVVGMMSEARRADADEYYEMAEDLRRARAELAILRAQLNDERFGVDGNPL